MGLILAGFPHVALVFGSVSGRVSSLVGMDFDQHVTSMGALLDTASEATRMFCAAAISVAPAGSAVFESGASADSSASAASAAANAAPSEGLSGQLSPEAVKALEAQCVDALASLAELKAAMAAFEMRIVDTLHSARVARICSVGISPRTELSTAEKRGLESEIALAQKEPRHRGAQALEMSVAVVNDMPATLTALASGFLTPERCEQVYRVTAPLTSTARSAIDSAVCGDPERIAHMGTRELRSLAAEHAQSVDRLAAAKRRAVAEANRYVSLRPLEDGMAQLTAVVPAPDGAAMMSALTASTLKVLTDPAQSHGRKRGAIMADLLRDLVLGGPVDGPPLAGALASGASTFAPTVELQLVMTERTLFSSDAEPAYLQGYGTLAADVSRDLVSRASTDGRVMIRRVFTAPSTGDLVGLESRSRIFPPGLKRFIELRDSTCATPWCDAPIRHADHVVGWVSGGRTTADNGQGLCEACNYAKQQAGWSSSVADGDRHSVSTRTPTGHEYQSIAPAPPGTISGSPVPLERDAS